MVELLSMVPGGGAPLRLVLIWHRSSCQDPSPLQSISGSQISPGFRLSNNQQSTRLSDQFPLQPAKYTGSV